MAIYACVLWPGFNQKNGQLESFFTRIFAVVCGGLPAFLNFIAYRPNAGGDLWWFAVICGRLWWFAVLCDGLRWFVF